MRVYISYRPDDKAFVGRLRFQLQDLLPSLEVKQSNPNVNIRTLDAIIKDMDFVLVVIGTNWLRTNKQAVSLLNATDDHVYCELVAALKYANVRIAPLLVDDARMPGKQDMPPGLTAFATINAASIKHSSFEKDSMQVAEMLRSPGDESSWLPSIEYGTIQIRCKQAGFLSVSRYLETDFPPVTVLIDGEEVGTMQLVNNTFDQKLVPGEHVVTLDPTDFTISKCKCSVLIRQGKTSVLIAGRNSFTGSLSLKPLP